MTLIAGGHDAGTTSSRSRRWARASGLLVDEWLFERAPPPDLSEHLVCTWRGDIGEMWAPLPDECVDLYWVDGSVWVSGPETRSFRSEARRVRPPANAVGVRFHPGVAPSFLGVSASDLRDVRIPLEAMWDDKRSRELADRVGCRQEYDARADELENAIRDMAARAWNPDPVALEVSARLRAQRTASVRDLARATSLSERQLNRRCTIAFGYGPAFLARIMRVQRFLRLARDQTRPQRIVDLAVASGYADQSHLTREVRSVMGMTPKDLVRSAPTCPIGSRPQPAVGVSLDG